MRRLKGFTLIEVLFVVIVLAAIAAFAIPRITRTIRQSQVDVDNANIAVINSQIELFRLNSGGYPDTNANYLANVLTNATYFGTPPVCPFNTAYVFNPATNLLTPHSH